MNHTSMVLFWTTFFNEKNIIRMQMKYEVRDCECQKIFFVRYVIIRYYTVTITSEKIRTLDSRLKIFFPETIINFYSERLQTLQWRSCELVWISVAAESRNT